MRDEKVGVKYGPQSEGEGRRGLDMNGISN